MLIHLLLWLASFIQPPVTTGKTISGQLLIRDSLQGTASFLSITVKSHGLPVAKGYSSHTGAFSILLPAGKDIQLDLLYSSLGIDTVYLAYIPALRQDTTLSFLLPLSPGKNQQGKIICPKCRQPDEIYKVRYGDNPVYVKQETANGRGKYSPLHNGIYEAGSCVSSYQSPVWHCERDNIRF